VNWFNAWIICAIVLSVTVWLGVEAHQARKGRILPPPVPDDRDSLRKWREICDLEET
jgi:hypothetical protein